MLQTSIEPLVHSYDVALRAIRCGKPGHPTSTKHARGVTCPECRRMLEAAREVRQPS